MKERMFKCLGFGLWLWLLACLPAVAQAPREEAWSGPTMGSSFSVKIVRAPLNDDALARLKAEVEATLKEVNRQMSHYQPDSELSRFNAHLSTEPFPVSPEFAKVVEFALDLHKRSGGAFDPTLGPLINLWGFGQKGMVLQPPSTNQITEIKKICGADKLEVVAGPALKKRVPQLQLNLSAVAAGFGADEVARILQRHGITNYFIDVAGEIATAGLNAQQSPWRVGIETPILDADPGQSIELVVPLSNAGLATSGNYRKYFVDAQGRRYSHILDPRTGRPIEHHLVSVTAIAADGMIADGLSTSLFVMGADEGFRWIEKYPGASACFMVLEADGQLRKIFSSRFPKPLEPK